MKWLLPCPRLMALLIVALWVAAVLALTSFLPIWSRYTYGWVRVEGSPETVESKGGMTVKYAPHELFKKSQYRPFWDDSFGKWDYYRNNNLLGSIVAGSLIALWPLSVLMLKIRAK